MAFQGVTKTPLPRLRFPPPPPFFVWSGAENEDCLGVAQQREAGPDLGFDMGKSAPNYAWAGQHMTGFFYVYVLVSEADAKDGVLRSQLVLSSHVSQCASDRNELVPAIEGIPPSQGRPQTALGDSGYLNEEQVRTLEGRPHGEGGERKMNVLVGVHAEAKRLRRRHDFRPVPTEQKKPPAIRSAFVREMKEKMERDESRAKYRLRKQTVEPVFGTIKQWMGFRQFLLRGHGKVSGEWQLVTLAYNVKRLWRMQCAQTAAS